MKKLILFVVLLWFIHSAFAVQNTKIDSLMTLLNLEKEDSLQVRILNSLAVYLLYDGKNKEALEFAEKALMLAQKTGQKVGEETVYNNIRAILQLKGDYPNALKNNFASLKIREELNDKEGIAGSYLNIAAIYFYLGNYADALKYDSIALEIRKDFRDSIHVATLPAPQIFGLTIAYAVTD